VLLARFLSAEMAMINRGNTFDSHDISLKAEVDSYPSFELSGVLQSVD